MANFFIFNRMVKLRLFLCIYKYEDEAAGVKTSYNFRAMVHNQAEAVTQGATNPDMARPMMKGRPYQSATEAVEALLEHTISIRQSEMTLAGTGRPESVVAGAPPITPNLYHNNGAVQPNNGYGSNPSAYSTYNATTASQTAVTGEQFLGDSVFNYPTVFGQTGAHTQSHNQILGHSASSSSENAASSQGSHEANTISPWSLFQGSTDSGHSSTEAPGTSAAAQNTTVGTSMAGLPGSAEDNIYNPAGPSDFGSELVLGGSLGSLHPSQQNAATLFPESSSGLCAKGRDPCMPEKFNFDDFVDFSGSGANGS